MKKYVKWTGIVLLSPVILFLVLSILLYLPPVQHFLVGQVTKLASESTGMQIQVGRLSLSFPLDLVVRNAQVIDKQDTILTVNELTVDVQLLPLLRKQVELDGLKLKEASVNTATIVEGMQLKGYLGEFYIESHGVKLGPETAVINAVSLKDTHLRMCLADTTAADTTESAPLYWKINLKQADLENVSFSLDMPLDSMSMDMLVGEAVLQEGLIDLHRPSYSIQHLILRQSAAAYHTGSAPVQPGLDPSHIELTNINLYVDSIYYAGNDIRANIQNFSLKERSGLELLSTKGRLVADQKEVRIPSLQFKTPDSYFEFEATADWDVIQPKKNSQLSARFFAEIGKSDVFKLAPDLPDDFIQKYPTAPLQLRAGIDGTLEHLKLTSLSAGIDGHLRLTATGDVFNVLDSLNRRAEINLNTRFTDTRFLQPLTGGTLIPGNTLLEGLLGMNGEELFADCILTPPTGSVAAKASYHAGQESYTADLTIDSLNLHEFMPSDSLFTLTASLQANGKGTDLFSPQTALHAEAGLSHLQYGSRIFSGLKVKANLAKSQADVVVDILDNAVKLSAELGSSIQQKKIEGELDVRVDNLDLQALQLLDTPLKTQQNLKLRFTTDLEKAHGMRASMTDIHLIGQKQTYKAKDIHVGFTTARDSLRCYANAGDLTFLLGAKGNIDYLTGSIDKLAAAFNQQWEAKNIDQAALRELLPGAQFRIFAKNDNPLANMLALQQIRFSRLYVNLTTSPVEGLNGEAYLYGLRTDSLELDTIYFNSEQTPEKLIFASGVKANKKPFQEAFDVSLHGDLGSDDAHLFIEYLNERKERGAYIGFVAALHQNGISLRISPDEPTLVYRPFRVNPDNYIYLSDKGRIHANLRLYDDHYTGLQFYSLPDSTVQQDLTLELNRINIAEFRRIVPYMPDIAGFINAEAHYIQQDKIAQVSLEANVESLAYNKNALGDWAFSGVYLPKETGEHSIDGFLMHNESQIADLNGSYFSSTNPKQSSSISANLRLDEFPLDIANAFVPDKMALLSGRLSGMMGVNGFTDQFKLDGSINLDSVGIEIPQFALKLDFDNRPVNITNSLLRFDEFSIFSRQTRSPFTINGTVDLNNLSNPALDLRMEAQNFELFNSKKNRESLVYGKLYVDFRSMLRGNMENLLMRGNMSILGNSDFAYILKDSPMTVEDKLGETVTFVNFNDTTASKNAHAQQLNLGSMDMLMTIHIDEAVQAKVDLNTNGSNYMLLEGGGDLSFQYTPEGSMLLNGRYSLLNGEMKYELPVIPLKTFYIQNGSYIEWTGNMMNPNLNIQASERMRAAVSDGENNTRNANFDVGVSITNRLENLGFSFTLEAPDDGALQNELAAMSAEEKNKLAVTMLVTGMYMGGSSAGKFDANSALNSFLQSEINNIAGSALKSIDLSVGMESNENSETGASGTNYNFQFAKRFWNNRFQVVIGGKISTGNNVDQSESFIDNISLEYRLDNSGTRYVKLFHDKNYESVLEGEVIETGIGVVLRKKVSRLGELFIFKKKKQPKAEAVEKKEKDETEEHN